MTVASDQTPKMTSVSTLDADKGADTIEVLAHRVRERFPEASLIDVCHRLLQIARGVRETTQ